MFFEASFEEVESGVIALGGDFFEDALIGLTTVVIVVKIVGIASDIKN